MERSKRVSSRQSRSRVPAKSVMGRGARMPAYDHPAIADGRTLYPSTVRHVNEINRALKAGYNHAKIGDVVRKGRWRGFRVFALTLEERATCPVSCRHWRSCYRNNVHRTERVVPGVDLERRLEVELGELAVTHDSFLVRLHVLGDFYAVRYVEFWERMRDRHPGLHVFGYSARVDAGDPIAEALMKVVDARWDRFAIRLSNAASTLPTTVSVETPMQAPPGAIVCPEQVGKTESCTPCALCWQTTRPIAFIHH